jgi:hypothetical protein
MIVRETYATLPTELALPYPLQDQPKYQVPVEAKEQAPFPWTQRRILSEST